MRINCPLTTSFIATVKYSLQNLIWNEFRQWKYSTTPFQLLLYQYVFFSWNFQMMILNSYNKDYIVYCSLIFLYINDEIFLQKNQCLNFIHNISKMKIYLLNPLLDIWSRFLRQKIVRKHCVNLNTLMPQCICDGK